MDMKDVIFLNSVAFVLGFTLVFSAEGVLLQTILSNIAFAAINALRVAGGAIMIAFGMLLIASLRYRIPIFASERRLKARRFSSSYATSFVFGIGFAIGWTPCVGAILGSIYAFAAAYPTLGFLLLLSYSLGIGVPFLAVGAFTSEASAAIQRFGSLLKYFNIMGGLFLIAIGILVVTNYIGILSAFLVGNQGAVTDAGQINLIVAFLAGLITFLSPCILPLLPAFFSYMAGTAASELKEKR